MFGTGPKFVPPLRLEAADFLHPPNVQLDLRPVRLQRFDATLAAPHQVGAQIRLGMDTGLATVTGQVSGDCPHQRIRRSIEENREQHRDKSGHDRCCALPGQHASRRWHERMSGLLWGRTVGSAVHHLVSAVVARQTRELPQ